MRQEDHEFEASLGYTLDLRFLEVMKMLYYQLW
jgi:hypothetical protein